MKTKIASYLLSSTLAASLAFSSNAITADPDLGKNNWAWGKDDVLGAGNRMTASSIKAALAAVEGGNIVELSHDVAMGAPYIEPIQTPYVMTLSRTSKNMENFLRDKMGATNDIGFYLERIEMTTHVSTHIDALGHVTIAAELYNGLDREQAASDIGLNHNGIEKSPPFIAKGILIDVATYKGVENLEPGYAISAADLQGALKKQGTNIPEGAIVFVHTGWGKNFTAEPQHYAHTGPGIGIEASKWLASQNVVAIGADNMALEVTPGEEPTVVFPVHQHLLVKQGIYIIENVKTDELAAKKLYETTIIMLPTKFRGATGTPLRIIALY
ncbi:MAG: cyclase family protein [Gammaproteobacteria bacterium]|nr:MAG: cyclase family protein [Gammaproteobacteria bacterium]RLA53653.1 MAG: cyclase family protein [Gammaproteobacteria bacterium]